MSVGDIHAQLSIGKFYSPTTSDWVEIINQTDEQITFADYLITDVANNKLTNNMLPKLYVYMLKVPQLWRTKGRFRPSKK